MFRGDVKALVRRGHEAEDGTYIDDPSGAPFSHKRQHPFYQTHRTPEVGLELAARFIQTRLLDCASQAKTRIVDQNINPPRGAEDGIDGGIHALVRPHIE